MTTPRWLVVLGAVAVLLSVALDDRAVATGQSELSGWPDAIPVLTAGLLIGLLGLGLWRRIAEYR